jgi:hypothetical protein
LRFDDSHPREHIEAISPNPNENRLLAIANALASALCIISRYGSLQKGGIMAEIQGVGGYGYATSSVSDREAQEAEDKLNEAETLRSEADDKRSEDTQVGKGKLPHEVILGQMAKEDNKDAAESKEKRASELEKDANRTLRDYEEGRANDQDWLA